MSYNMGATNDASRVKFLSQFTGNDLYRGSDNKYGENILVVPYKSTSNIPSELWYKVSNSGFQSLKLNVPDDELNFYVLISGQYYVKGSYLDMMGYQPLSWTDSFFSMTTGFDFKKYLPYIAAGGGLLLLVLLLKKKKSE